MPNFKTTLFSILALSCSTALNEQQYVQAYLKQDSDFLEYWIDSTFHVAFLACTGHNKAIQHPLLSVLPKAWTLWSYPLRGIVYTLLKNTAINVKTVVFVLDLDEKEKCLGKLRKIPMITSMTDWIALPPDSTTLKGEANSLNQSTQLCSETSASKAIQNGKVCLSLKGASVISRKYGAFDIVQSDTFISAFSGERIELACMLIPGNGFRKATSCTVVPYTDVFSALVAMNTTLTFKSYSSFEAVVNAMLEGSVDVYAYPIKMEESGFRFFIYPQPLQYTRQKFYVHRNKSPVRSSVVELIGGSYVGILFLIFVTLVVWIALSVFDYLDYGLLQKERIMDSGMFLVASFLANSAPVDTGYSSGAVHFCRIGRVITLIAWFLGILPISSYFRSEFTSRLTITRPPDHVDTVEELSEALDRQEIQPCIVKHGCFYAAVEGANPIGSQSFEAKVAQAYQRNGKKTVFPSSSKCLECAMKPGFVCLLCGQQSCDDFVRQNFVVSRDSLQLTLVTTPVGKSYRLAKAYDQLLRRLFETAAPPFHKRIPCKEEMFDDLRSVCDIEKKPSQVLELSQFFWFYLFLLFSSIIILCLELIFSSFMSFRCVACISRITDFKA